jgi:hypothetical protein
MKTWAGNLAFLFLISIVFVGGFLSPQTASAAAAPSITTQPQSQSLLAGTNAAFSVIASGQTPLSYQWSFNGTNLTNSAHLGGATSPTLIISKIVASDGGNYQVVVSNSHGTATSSNAALTVLFPASITTQPTNQTVLLGSTAVFAVAGSGTAPLYYQWQKNGTNLADGGRVSGTSTSTLTITNIQMSNFGSYRLVFSNAYGVATSSEANLSVVPLLVWGDGSSGQTNIPTILTNAVAIAGGGGHCLALKSDGTLISWGNNAYGETNVPSGLSNVMAIASGLYFNLALKTDGTAVGWGENGYGEANVPAGLSNVVAIATGQSSSLALKNDGTVVGWGQNGWGQTTVPAGLTNVIAIAGGGAHSLALKNDGTVVGWGDNSYGQATPPAGLTNVIAIAGGAFHSLALKNDGTVTAWGNNMSGQIDVPAGLSNVVAIAAGNVHNLALKSDGTVVGWGDNTYGQAVLPAGINDVVAIAAGFNQSMALVRNPTTQVPPIIWWQPLNRTLPTGQTTIFDASVIGSLPMSFQWYFNGTPLAGETNHWLILQSIHPEQAGIYQFVAANNFGSVTSQVAVVSETPNIVAQPMSQSVLVGNNGNFIATAIGIGPLNYQWYFNGTPLTDGGRVSGSTTTNLAIATVQTNDAGSYQLVVTNNYGTATSTSATLTVLVPAAITGQPTNRNVLSGSSVTFTVTAIGTAPLSYLWYSNGVALANVGRISGVITATLNISGALTNDSGSYQVIVTNNYGSATSSVATLTVYAPVQITGQPSSQAVLLGSNASFTVTASGTTPGYQWFFNGTPLLDGGRISGSATPTLNIANVQGSDAGGYVAVVTNLLSAATSRTASLTPQASLSSSVRYVNLNNTNPLPPYLDWSTAATNIQDAIDAAVAGDLVLVTNGTYSTGGRVVFGTMTNRVVINKAVTVQSVNGSAATIIAGLPNTGGYLSTGIRCMYLTNGAALIGFTLTNGASRLSGNITNEQSGAAVWCESTNAIISNCALMHSYANQFGGAAYQGTLNNCIITNNQAFISGGGTYLANLNNCVVAGNKLIQGSGGGGASLGILNNCLVIGNFAPGYGGGTYLSTMNGCIVSNNSAGFGGGVCLGVANNSLISSNRASLYGGGAGSNTLNNCILTANNGGKFGGGAYQSTLNNCTLVNNTASDYGGGAYGGNLGNCTIVSNSVYSSGGGAYSAVLNNCIVYYNRSPKNSNIYSGNLNYCCTKPLPTGGWGNITNEPVFVNLAGGDFHLQTNSPCINAGNNTYVTSSTDLDGNPRIKGGTVDIGAYEYQTPSSVLSYAWAQQYGLPTDGTADYADTDGDGMNNWQEWRTGTIPNDPVSLLKMLTSTTDISGTTVTWQSVSGMNYFIQRSSNLGAQPPFSTIQTNIVGQAGATSWLDTTAVGDGPFFYRVGVQ